MTKLLWLSGAISIVLVLSSAANGQFPVAAGKLLPSVAVTSRILGPRPVGGSAADSPLVAEGYGKLPLAFEPNLGQTDAKVRFLARGGGMTAFFTDTDTIMVLSRAERRDPKTLLRARREPAKVEQAVVRMKLQGTGQPRQTRGLERLPGISNYFIGNDPAKWRTDVPHYARIECEGVYPGIDLVWYGNQRQLEYDFVVGPGANPKQIQVAYEGVESVGVEANGELVLRTALGEVRQQRPRVYQEIGGKRVEVGARYALLGRNRVSFELAKYDRKRELRIDPVVLVYSTYLGGNGEELPQGIAVDAAGSAYITGQTTSTNLPTQSSYQATLQGTCNVFVTKLAPSGNALVYSTYLGGSGQDMGYAIAVDGAGSAYVTGSAYSTNFPTRAPYQANHGGGVGDGFVTKLAPTGNALVYSTYLGGSGVDAGNGIAVDGAGSAYVTGYTSSTNFPTQSAYQATYPGGGGAVAFVTKLTPAGSALVYSTYLGGLFDNSGNGIAVDGAGSAYVTGYTSSTNFPTQSAYQATYQGGTFDAFVTKLAPAGNALAYSTYLGGSGQDGGFGIAVDGTGSAYVTGYTSSTNFPTQSPYQASYQRGTFDAFVTKLSSAGNTLVYSTYLGGSGQDWGRAIAVDGAGSACVTGQTDSADFATQSAYQATNGGGQDAFVTKLTPAGNALAYSTYLGGGGGDGGYAIAMDAAGSAYVTGATLSANFPTQSAYQTTIAGDWDAFVTKLRLPLVSPVLTAPAAGATGVSVTPTLSWNATLEATSYDVYLGTSNSPPFVTNTTSTGYSPATLAGGTTYYWRVVAKNSVDSATSATWSFTTQTPPPAPVLVSPANGSTVASVTPSLSWNASSGATSYDVYFGASTPPPLVTNTGGTSYAPGTLTAGTRYYWQVTAKNSAGSNSSAIWSFTTQVAGPVLISPVSGAAGVVLAPTLSWAASTGATSYDVYFGTTSTPPLVTNTTGTSYAPGTLSAGTRYYWQVTARNSGGSGNSVIWSFSTQVAAPVLALPADGASGVASTTSLTWAASTGATSYDVYFGTASPPPLVTNTAGTSYAPGTLSAGTVYYWRVAAKDAGGSNTSAIWSFTTLVTGPGLTSPANGAVGVSWTPTLSWTASSGAISYDVKFGTSFPPPVVTNTTATSYSPGTLAPGTVYYWQVVARNSGGLGASGTWAFTTQLTPPVLVAPENGALGVSLTPNLSWSGSVGAASYDVYLGTSSSPPLVTSTTGTSYTAGPLTGGTVYYWRVVANGSGSSSSAMWSFTTQVAAPALVSPVNGAAGVGLTPSLTWSASANATSYDVYFGTQVSPPLVTTTTETAYQPGPLSEGALYFWRVVAKDAWSASTSAVWSFTTPVAPLEAVALQFIPVTPCRVVDTRAAAGPFGGPSFSGNSSRAFAVPQSGCGIPATAQAYSLNVTVVPKGPLSYLSLWPTGQTQPLVSTLNSFGGIVVANAAIVPAGSGGAISMYVTNPTDVIVDINGYFATGGGENAFSFYPAQPCRVADTRGAAGPFGGPNMTAQQSRDFAVPASGCGMPTGAKAYSLNVTVVPDGYLGYLTTWPAGQAAPLASTLNSWTGKVVANAALVPAGASGAISVYASNPTAVILDTNGYFGAPGGAGALSFYPVTPCRVADTRGATGPFGGPEMEAATARSLPIPASGCGIPPTAAAYSVNVTVVPDGMLSYLTTWPTGSSQPGVSTLNSWDGAVVANAAIVPAGVNGAISVYVTNRTQVILDINGYFAP